MSSFSIGIIFCFVLTGKNALEKPRLLRPLPCYIEKISVGLNPSIDKFEEELCKQVNEDRMNREQKVADGSTITIQERRLQVMRPFVNLYLNSFTTYK